MDHSARHAAWSLEVMGPVGVRPSRPGAAVRAYRRPCRSSAGYGQLRPSHKLSRGPSHIFKGVFVI